MRGSTILRPGTMLSDTLTGQIPGEPKNGRSGSAEEPELPAAIDAMRDSARVSLPTRSHAPAGHEAVERWIEEALVACHWAFRARHSTEDSWAAQFVFPQSSAYLRALVRKLGLEACQLTVTAAHLGAVSQSQTVP